MRENFKQSWKFHLINQKIQAPRIQLNFNPFRISSNHSMFHTFFRTFLRKFSHANLHAQIFVPRMLTVRKKGFEKQSGSKIILPQVSTIIQLQWLHPILRVWLRQYAAYCMPQWFSLSQCLFDHLNSYFGSVCLLSVLILILDDNLRWKITFWQFTRKTPSKY